MNHRLTQGVRHDLVLADGSHWEITAGDEEAASIVSQMGCAMQLRVTTGAIEPAHRGNLCRLFVQVDAHASVAECYVPLASDDDGVVVCILSPCDYWGVPIVKFLRISHAL